MPAARPAGSIPAAYQPLLCDPDPQTRRRNLARIHHLPAVLIHGRYDVSTPLDIAWRLHRAWAGSELVILDDAGHGGDSFAREFVAALDRLAG